MSHSCPGLKTAMTQLRINKPLCVRPATFLATHIPSLPHSLKNAYISRTFSILRKLTILTRTWYMDDAVNFLHSPTLVIWAHGMSQPLSDSHKTRVYMPRTGAQDGYLGSAVFLDCTNSHTVSHYSVMTGSAPKAVTEGFCGIPTAKANRPATLSVHFKTNWTPTIPRKPPHH